MNDSGIRKNGVESHNLYGGASTLFLQNVHHFSETVTYSNLGSLLPNMFGIVCIQSSTDTSIKSRIL